MDKDFYENLPPWVMNIFRYAEEYKEISIYEVIEIATNLGFSENPNEWVKVETQEIYEVLRDRY